MPGHKSAVCVRLEVATIVRMCQYHPFSKRSLLAVYMDTEPKTVF